MSTPLNSSNIEKPRFGWSILYVDDVAGSVRLYTEAFGLVVRFIHESGTYAEFETGETTLALSDRRDAAQNFGFESPGLSSRPADLLSLTGNITLVCSDVAARFTHAVASGAVAIAPPMEKPWGQVCAYVSDPDGHIIEFATPIG
jgi:lactoylglutathione lyase